jgi:hypothetical protein
MQVQNAVPWWNSLMPLTTESEALIYERHSLHFDAICHQNQFL